jgi:hypothetical protein
MLARTRAVQLALPPRTAGSRASSCGLRGKRAIWSAPNQSDESDKSDRSDHKRCVGITPRHDQRFLTRGGVSPERSYRTVGTAKPRNGGGAASPRFPLVRRSESASHIGAPSGLAPDGHVPLSATVGGATEPAGDGRARAGIPVIQGLRLGPRSSEKSPAPNSQSLS